VPSQASQSRRVRPRWWSSSFTEQGGGTPLRVIESGFASLAIPAQDRESAVEDNINGWEQQLGFAKRDVEHG